MTHCEEKRRTKKYHSDQREVDDQKMRETKIIREQRELENGEIVQAEQGIKL